MKKIIQIFSLLLVFFAGTGCDDKNQEIKPVKLDVPEIALGEITMTAVSFSWKKVDNSVGYEYTLTSGEHTIMNESVPSNETSAIIEDLTAETAYKLTMRAVGNDKYETSQWTETTFTTAKPDPVPDPDPDPEPEPDSPKVYIVGAHSNNTAVLWIDGAMQELTDGGIVAVANDIYVTENKDIYIVGWDTPDDTGKTRAIAWINGRMVYLSDGKKDVQAKSVFVHGEDVYIAGHEVGVGNKVLLWKNGVQTTLPSSYDYAEASSIAISEDGDIYVVGYDNGPAVWKNGQKMNENLGDEATQLLGVCIQGEYIYYSGYRTDSEGMYRAMVWKGTQSTELTDGTYDCYANAIWASSEGDVYVAGTQSSEPKKAMFWKNGTSEDLTSDSCKAFDVLGFENDLYVVGQISTGTFPTGTQMAAVWKNGEMQKLLNYRSEARAIFIR